MLRRLFRSNQIGIYLPSVFFSLVLIILTIFLFTLVYQRGSNTVLASETVTYQVNASGNDAYQNFSGNFLTSSPMDIGGNSQYYGGLRFTNVSIPQNATITDAYVEVYTPSSAWITIGYEIYAEYAGNSQVFSSGSLPSTRTATTKV